MPADIKKLERALSVTLPEPFVTAIRTVEKTCTDWPEKYANLDQRRLLTDIDQLIAINNQFRSKPSLFVQDPKDVAKKWPHEYVVFACNESLCCFFDATECDPEIHTIHEKKVRVKDHLTPRHYTNFKALTESIKNQYSTLRRAVRERDQEDRLRERSQRRPPAPKTECPDLVEEGWTLARPALRLSIAGDRYVGVWGGAGIVAPPPRGSWQHWITVGCSHLPLNPRGLKGLISVYESDVDQKTRVVHDERMRLPREPDGQKLFGTKSRCLPSIGVVLSKGSAEVRRWLRGQNIWSGDSEGARFEDQEPVDRYEAEFQANHPHYLDDCDAMLGGWGIAYPDSKWRTLMKNRYLITTFRDAEPWLEVYDSGKAFSGYARIT